MGFSPMGSPTGDPPPWSTGERTRTESWSCLNDKHEKCNGKFGTMACDCECHDDEHTELSYECFEGNHSKCDDDFGGFTCECDCHTEGGKDSHTGSEILPNMGERGTTYECGECGDEQEHDGEIRPAQVIADCPACDTENAVFSNQDYWKYQL